MSSNDVWSGVSVNLRKLGKALQDALDPRVASDLQTLEMSSVPEVEKAQTRGRLKLRLEPFRHGQERIALSAIYNERGITDIDDALAAEWVPTFSTRELDPVTVARFLSFVPVLTWVLAEGSLGQCSGGHADNFTRPRRIDLQLLGQYFWLHSGVSRQLDTFAILWWTKPWGRRSGSGIGFSSA